MENSNNPNEEKINQQINQQFGNSGQVPIPNSVGVLVLGIISIVLCWCYGIVPIACAIIAIVLGNKGMKVYGENPTAYTQASLSNLKGGRVCAIIGLCLASVYVLFIIIYFIIVGAAAFSLMNLGAFN